MAISAHYCFEGMLHGRIPEGKGSPNWSFLRRGSFSNSAEGFLFCMATATIIRGMGCLPICWRVFSASGSWVILSFFRTIPVEVSSPASHTSSGLLLQIDPDMSEPQKVEALTSVGFNPDDDMSEFGQFKYFRCPLIACERNCSNFEVEILCKFKL